jgi:hypothetical protein
MARGERRFSGRARGQRRTDGPLRRLRDIFPGRRIVPVQVRASVPIPAEVVPALIVPPALEPIFLARTQTGPLELFRLTHGISLPFNI